jgi:type II secretory pathway pseudopilin PulG
MIDGIALGVGGAIAFFLAPESVRGIGRLVLGVAYFTAVPVLWRGQTLGKTAAGLAIAREDGEPLSYVTTFVRYLGYLANILTLGIGFLVAAFTENKRGLHDYIAGTRVIQIEEVGLGRKICVICVGLLLPVVAVVGILAAIAIPQFMHLQSRAKEGAAKGRLGSLRAAASIYYGDHEGVYPTDLSQLPQAAQPPAVPDHPNAAGVEVYGAEVCTGSTEYGAEIAGDKLRDTGKWGYVADPKAKCYGQIFVDCTHKDAKGKPWYTY